jgi:hypothetical protein
MNTWRSQSLDISSYSFDEVAVQVKLEDQATLRLRESRNSVSTCSLVTETELQLFLFIGLINSERVNNVTSS